MQPKAMAAATISPLLSLVFNKAKPMQTEFIRLTLPRHSLLLPFHDAVEQALQAHGQPLRWAITATTTTHLTVEAVILKTPPNP